MWVRSLALLSRLRIWRCPGLWCRSQMQLGSGIDMVIRPLAWEPPYAVSAALEKTKKKKKKKKERKKEKPMQGGCEKTIICKPRNEALGETSPANTLILDF